MRKLYEHYRLMNSEQKQWRFEIVWPKESLWISCYLRHLRW